jgi:hypothetical protein
MAKVFALGIKNRRHIDGLIVVDQAFDHVDDAINGAGWLTIAIAQFRHGVIGPKQVGRAIY